jgi:DNA-binding MarR family transcriptional regulator
LKNPPGGAKNPYAEETALAHLLEFAERQGKRLLLICENMNDLFSVLPERESWKLRNVLQTEKRIMLIGSAIVRFNQIDHNKKAFYDFFKILELERLTAEECAELWCNASGESIPPLQAEALRILTGGLPRLLSILAWFGRELSFLNLIRNLEELIDDHTEYFKSALEVLPPIERKVFVSLARLWVNSPVGIIATEAEMDQPKTSAILDRLTKRGIVEEYEEEGERPLKRGKTYQLTERLFNIFYLIRRGGPEALLVCDVINFMIQAFGEKIKDTLLKSCSMDMQGMSEIQLGSEHPDTLGSMGNLFRLHCRMNKTEPAISELSELLKHPAYVRNVIRLLIDDCTALASVSCEVAKTVAETIENSPSKELLYPLYSAIKLYLGDKMRLPREVREIAKIIQT